MGCRDEWNRTPGSLELKGDDSARRHHMLYALEALELFALILPLAVFEWCLMLGVVAVCETCNWEERR